MSLIDFESLGIPDHEDPKDAEARLEVIHRKLLEDKGIAYKPGKNSPGFVPSGHQAREVSVMACLGLSSKDIALVLNIEEKMLKIYYAKELKVSHNLANAMVARQALQMALSGRFPDMTKFWLKSQAKWKETTGTEPIAKGEDGAEDGNSAKDRLKDILDAGAAVQKAAQAKAASPAARPQMDVQADGAA